VGLGAVGDGEQEHPLVVGALATRSINSRLPARADTAKPLPNALPKVDRSGVTP
jgi:hypothetical protein